MKKEFLAPCPGRTRDTDLVAIPCNKNPHSFEGLAGKTLIMQAGVTSQSLHMVSLDGSSLIGFLSSLYWDQNKAHPQGDGGKTDEKAIGEQNQSKPIEICMKSNSKTSVDTWRQFLLEIELRSVAYMSSTWIPVPSLSSHKLLYKSSSSWPPHLILSELFDL